MGVDSVTVIIVNFNAGTTLLRTLSALQQQEVQPEEVIVVDNRSVDGSIETAAKIFPNLRYICLATNTGFAAANNLAISQCKTPLVALLNPDAFPTPQWLGSLLDAASQYPHAASFGSRQLMDNQLGTIDGIEDVCHVSGQAWRGGHGRPCRASDDVGREIFSPCAAAALYRTRAIRQVGGFDEDFFCYMEDVDLGFRLRLAGWQSRYVPLAKVLHVGSATSGGRHSDFSVYHGSRNLVWMYAKNMPNLLFWLFLPAHLALSVVSLGYFAWHGKGMVILRAKRDAFKGLRGAWRKRQKIQGSRAVSNLAVLGMLNHKLIPNKRTDTFKGLVK